MGFPLIPLPIKEAIDNETYARNTKGRLFPLIPLPIKEAIYKLEKRSQGG